MTSRTLASTSLALLLTVSSVAAQSPAPAQPRPPQTYPAFLQAQYASLKRNIVGSADKMPAEHFPFKPAPEVMTYAGLLGHIVDVQYGFCNAVKGGANPAAGKALDTLTDKAALIAAVKDAFAYCDDAFAGLTTENALEMLTLGTAPNQRQVARANQLTMVLTHGNEHYGNLVTYLRIKGIVPPSSTPQPPPAR
jgi:uncharacterized damage-inducible protein DinB